MLADEKKRADEVMKTGQSVFGITVFEMEVRMQTQVVLANCTDAILVV